MGEMKSQSDDLGKCCRTISDLCVTRLDVSEREREGEIAVFALQFCISSKGERGTIDLLKHSTYV